jgi:lipid A 3-O-deacylase
MVEEIVSLFAPICGGLAFFCIVQASPSMKIVLAAVVLLCGGLAFAQARPESGGHEFEVWSGGGYSVPGGTANTGVWNLGARFGWILTRPFGPGFLKGRFEYAVDGVPVYMIFQPGNTAYGAGFNPLNLKWNFATPGRLAPYLELSGGTLFTNRDVPNGTNTVNFTPSVALGTHFLGDSWNWSLEVRYLHISNAGLAVPNPGLNTVQVRVGVGKFWGRKGKK